MCATLITKKASSGCLVMNVTNFNQACTQTHFFVFNTAAQTALKDAIVIQWRCWDVWQHAHTYSHYIFECLISWLIEMMDPLLLSYWRRHLMYHDSLVTHSPDTLTVDLTGKSSCEIILYSFNQVDHECFNCASDDSSEEFHKEIVSFLVPLWTFVSDTREWAKKSNLVRDRWSFEGCLTDISTYCYQPLCCLPSPSDKRVKKRLEMGKMGWRVGNCTLGVNRNSFSVTVGAITTVTRTYFVRDWLGSHKRWAGMEMKNSPSKP